jgi:hypothetical protein
MNEFAIRPPCNCRMPMSQVEKPIRIGNSKGARIPAELIRAYHLERGFVMKPVQDGILIAPADPECLCFRTRARHPGCRARGLLEGRSGCGCGMRFAPARGWRRGLVRNCRGPGWIRASQPRRPGGTSWRADRFPRGFHVAQQHLQAGLVGAQRGAGDRLVGSAGVAVERAGAGGSGAAERGKLRGPPGIAAGAGFPNTRGRRSHVRAVPERIADHAAEHRIVEADPPAGQVAGGPTQAPSPARSRLGMLRNFAVFMLVFVPGRTVGLRETGSGKGSLPDQASRWQFTRS